MFDPEVNSSFTIVSLVHCPVPDAVMLLAHDIESSFYFPCIPHTMFSYKNCKSLQLNV